jgi:hypothetical protein
MQSSSFIYSWRGRGPNGPLVADFRAEVAEGGIGHYEYWGSHCFDSQPCVDSVQLLPGDYSPEEEAFLAALSEDCDFLADILDAYQSGNT